MKRLLLCGLVLMLVSAFLPHTTCSGYDNPIIEVSELRIEQTLIPMLENDFSAIICLHATTEITGNIETGPVNKFHDLTANFQDKNEIRSSTNVLITGFT
jgi:hypothetical protein